MSIDNLQFLQQYVITPGSTEELKHFSQDELKLINFCSDILTALKQDIFLATEIRLADYNYFYGDSFVAIDGLKEVFMSIDTKSNHAWVDIEFAPNKGIYLPMSNKQVVLIATWETYESQDQAFLVVKAVEVANEA